MYCILKKVCDFSNDCQDSADEKACGNYTRCNFDMSLNPMCDWNDDDDSDIKWKRANGQSFLASTLNYPTFGRHSNFNKCFNYIQKFFKY